MDSPSSVDNPDMPAPGMIVIMGVTGSGKSHFINTLVADSVKEGPGLHSCTVGCQIVEAKIGEESTVAVVDTPGFDDTNRSDAEILSEITTFLLSQYQLGIPLKGIIYLHRITDQRMQGSALRNFKVFQELCGEDALQNVVLMTTMWDKLPTRLEGLDRDQELRKDFWSLMEARGSYIASFDGSKEMAEAMIMMLAAKPPVVLSVQRELHDERKELGDTLAGQLLAPVLEDKLSAKEDEIAWLRARLAEAGRKRNQEEIVKLSSQTQKLEEEREHHRRQIASMRVQIAKETQEKISKESRNGKWKTALGIFCSVTGLTVSVVFNLLPLFGFC